MSELEALTALRAFFPALAALSSLALVPLINFWRGSQRDDAATYATIGVQILLLATAVGAPLASANDDGEDDAASSTSRRPGSDGSMVT